MTSPAPGAGATVLAAAASALAAVAFAGRSADDVLGRDGVRAELRPAMRAVTLGSLRWYWRLEAMVATVSAGKPLAPTLRALLLVALHQLEYSRNAPEAIVSSAVDAARLLRQSRATGLVNALLRRFLRERAVLLEQLLADPAASSAHPPWLLQSLRASWPQYWQQIVAANNEHPPMSLRLDLSRITREGYLAQLAAAGMQARALPWLASAVVLERPVMVSELPGFAHGLVSVQDAGAQLACALLAVTAGQRVLDACAAPGGKTGALLEAGGDIDLTAVDIDSGRLQRIADNLRRLRRTAHLVTADLTDEPLWCGPERFDSILVDAPCSATGVIRRHPDIKLLRRPADMPALALTQHRILSGCLKLLKPGGRLLYSTCSVLPAENERIVEAVLAGMPQARVLALPEGVMPADGLPRSIGMQLLPGNAAQTDGFYYACLTVT